MQQRQFKVFSFDSSWYCQYELWKRDVTWLSSTLIHFWILHVDVTWMTSHIKLYSSYMFFTLEIKLTVLLKEKLFKGMIHMLLLALLFQCCTRLHSCRGRLSNRSEGVFSGARQNIFICIYMYRHNIRAGHPDTIYICLSVWFLKVSLFEALVEYLNLLQSGQKIVYSSPCSFVCLRKYVILFMWNGKKSLCASN